MQDKPLVPGASPELPARPDTQWVMVFNLILRHGKEETKKTYKVNKKRLVIGSALSSDIRVQQNAISNVHAVVEIDDNGKATIFDMASETGVFLNDKKIVSEELKDGDELKIGFATLTFKKVAVTEAAKAVPPEAVRSTGTGRKLFYDTKEDFRPLILEDERNVIQIFDYPDPGETCLQVVMYWGDVILDVAHIVGTESVTIGESSKSTFLVPGMHTDYELASAQGALTTLQFSGEMNGVVRSANRIQKLSELNGSRFELKREDLAKIQFREFTFYFSYSPVPPHLRRQRVLERDPLYMQIWFSSVGLTAAFLVLLASLTPEKPLEPEEVPPPLVVKIFQPIPPPPPPPVKKEPVPKPVEPKKVAVKPPPPPKKPPPPRKVVVKPPPAPKKIAPAKTKPSPKPVVQVRGSRPQPSGGNQGEGAKAAGTEGRKGAPNAKKATIAQNASRGNPNAKTPTKSQVQGPGNVEAMFSDLGGNISKSMAAGAAGARAAGSNLGFGNTTTEGVGGLGQLGDGKGGGGTSRNSQGLSNKGFGDGKVGKGLGAIGSGGNLSGSGVGRPSIEVGNASETIVMGGLDKSVIDEYIRRHLRQIRGCYEKQLNSNPKLAGRIATRFVITGSGRVSQAGVTSSSMGNPTVEGCVLGILKRIEFPEPLGGGIVEVDYPFSFMPSVGG